MASVDLQERIIDGDGHVVEDIASVLTYMPEEFTGKSFGVGRSPFPPLDHLHAANRHFIPKGAFANVAVDGWVEFLQDVGIESTVLYTTHGLGFGKIISKDWAVALAQAYNNWLSDTYVKANPRFQGMGLIPLQEPAAAVEELRRIVEDLGFVGAMLPSTGAGQSHLGSKRYWPIYAEAERLGCAIGIHGGAHEGFLMDDLSPYAPVNALGHPFGQMVSFAGIVFNGIFDKWPGVRIGFLEAGSAWLLTCMERFHASWESHVQYDPAERYLQLAEGENLLDYIRKHIDQGRIFVGVEGDELTLAEAVRQVGNKPFIYSSDFPHEVDRETCQEEIAELRENPELTEDDKAAILWKNSARFYKLGAA